MVWRIISCFNFVSIWWDDSFPKSRVSHTLPRKCGHAGARLRVTSGGQKPRLVSRMTTPAARSCLNFIRSNFGRVYRDSCRISVHYFF